MCLLRDLIVEKRIWRVQIEIETRIIARRETAPERVRCGGEAAGGTRAERSTSERPGGAAAPANIGAPDRTQTDLTPIATFMPS